VRHQDQPAPDRARIARLVVRLSEMVRRAGEASDDISTAGRGLYLRHAAAGIPECFRSPAVAAGVPSIVLVVDCSSSMGSVWADGGRELILAWRELGRRGTVNVSIWLTWIGGRMPLPVRAPDAVWHAIWPKGGGEGFRATLSAIDAELRRARLVVCYSDGALTDGAVNASEWRAKGVDLLGTSIVPAKAEVAVKMVMREALTGHFGTALLGDTAEDLASQLGVRLGTRRW